MNKTAINKTIKALRNSSTFAMGQVFNSRCDSPSCLIGHALHSNMSAADYFRAVVSSAGGTPTATLARDILGINNAVAKHLFTPTTHSDGYSWRALYAPNLITQAHAIACLELFRDTGKIDWKATK